MAEKRKDSSRRVLREGESQRKDGTYDYRWRTTGGKRHSIYAKTLEELREKEAALLRDKSNGIRTDAANVTLNDIYDMWAELKKGLKDNTFQNYQYMYNQFVYPDFGKLKVTKIKRSDVRRFYNLLADERNLKIATIDNIHTVLHQVLEMAVEDDYLRNNPSDNALKELKQSRGLDTEKKQALTVEEQMTFMRFLEKNGRYNHWKPIFEIMLNTGLRVGEITGLRWDDVDFENNTISVDHTLVYYNHAKNGCYFDINTPKTKAGRRTVPMTDNVKEAFMQEKQYQEEAGISCDTRIGSYTNFIFVNRFGNVQHQGTLNKALRRIIRDCNQEILEKETKGNAVLLPRFSCHILRHTFATRLCEAGVNMKVIQDILGHADISTTMNIYTDATKELKERELSSYSAYLEQYAKKEKESDDMVIGIRTVGKQSYGKTSCKSD